MRLFIRKAKIDNAVRESFERYGIGTLQLMLSSGGIDSFVGREGHTGARKELLAWLTEQYDRAERKETWSLTMEFAITVFVLAELLGFGPLLQRLMHLR
jgi:hypothetical protein